MSPAKAGQTWLEGALPGDLSGLPQPFLKRHRPRARGPRYRLPKLAVPFQHISQPQACLLQGLIAYRGGIANDGIGEANVRRPEIAFVEVIGNQLRHLRDKGVYAFGDGYRRATAHLSRAL